MLRAAQSNLCPSKEQYPPFFDLNKHISEVKVPKAIAQEIPFLNRFIGHAPETSAVIIEPIPELTNDLKLFKQGIIFGDYISYQNPGYIGVLKIVDEKNLYVGYILWNPENSDTAPYTGIRQNHDKCAILLKQFAPYAVEHSDEKAVTFPKSKTGLEVLLPSNLTRETAYILSAKQLFTAISNKYTLLGGYIVNATTFIVNSTGNALYSVYNVTNTALNTTILYVSTSAQAVANKIITTTSSVLLTTGIGLFVYGVSTALEANAGKKRKVGELLGGVALAGAGGYIVLKNQ